MGKVKTKRSEKIATITDLPIGVWTETYLDRLRAMKADRKIVSFDDFSSDTDVKLFVKLSPELHRLKKANLINALSLQKSHTFEKGLVGLDSTGKVRVYDSLLDILKEYFEVRQDLYVKRHRELKRQKEAQRDFRVNQVNFIEALTKNEISLLGRSKQEIIGVLKEKGFQPNPLKAGESYDYLLSMPMSSFTSGMGRFVYYNIEYSISQPMVQRR